MVIYAAAEGSLQIYLNSMTPDLHPCQLYPTKKKDIRKTKVVLAPRGKLTQLHTCTHRLMYLCAIWSWPVSDRAETLLTFWSFDQTSDRWGPSVLACRCIHVSVCAKQIAWLTLRPPRGGWFLLTNTCIRGRKEERGGQGDEHQMELVMMMNHGE